MGLISTGEITTTEPKYPSKCYNKNCALHDDSESGCTVHSVWAVDICDNGKITSRAKKVIER